MTLQLTPKGKLSDKAKSVRKTVMERLREAQKVDEGVSLAIQDLDARFGGPPVPKNPAGDPEGDRQAMSSKGTPETLPVPAEVKTDAGVTKAAGPPMGPRLDPRTTPIEPRIVQALRRVGGIEIDGKLDDAAWGKAQVQQDFVKVVPDWGRPAARQTKFRIVYDDDAILLHRRRGGRDSRRDHGSVSASRRHDPDWRVRLAGAAARPAPDPPRRLRLLLNPNGVQIDNVVADDDRFLWSWYGFWEAKTTRGPMAGPRSSDPVHPAAPEPRHGTDVGVQPHPVLAQRQREGSGTLTKPLQSEFALFGDIIGFEGIGPQRPIALMPYALGGMSVV